MHAYKYSCNVLLENLLLSTTKTPIVMHCIIVFLYCTYFRFLIY